MTKCIGFKYVAQKNARVLILGSLPGALSLQERQYYAKRTNSFWKIMAHLTGCTPDMSYTQRLFHLKRKGIALWDVCASATRVGSLDSSIQKDTVISNDFKSFFKSHPKIELICFNGQPAEKLFVRLVLPTLSTPGSTLPRKILPSTSPAHAGMTYEKKLFIWERAIGSLIMI